MQVAVVVLILVAQQVQVELVEVVQDQILALEPQEQLTLVVAVEQP
jgi:hypothetical protein